VEVMVKIFIGLLFFLTYILGAFIFVFDQVNPLAFVFCLVAILSCLVLIFGFWNKSKEFQKKKTFEFVRYFYNGFVVLGICSLICFLSLKFNSFVDLTSSKLNKLTSRSQEILKEVSLPLKIKVLAYKKDWIYLEEILELFKQENRYIDYELKIPEQEETLIREFQIQNFPVAIYEYKVQRILGKEFSAKAITLKIQDLLEQQKIKVCWLIDKKSVPLDQTPRGASYLQNEIVTQGYDFMEATESTNKDSCGLFLGFNYENFEELERITKLEIPMVIGFDPDFTKSPEAKKWDFLGKFGGQNKPIINAEASQLKLETLNLFFEERELFFPLSFYFEKIENIEIKLSTKEFPLTWAEGDLEGLLQRAQASFDPILDKKGPLGVVVKSGNKILLGSAQFINNNYAQKFPMNSIFLMNQIEELMGRTKGLIRPYQPKSILRFTEQSLKFFRYGLLFALPLFFLILSYFRFRWNKSL
jgi:hypothetical protein